MKKKSLVLKSFAIIIASCFIQQTINAQSSLKYKKATLSYVDLSDSAKITSKPIKTRKIRFRNVDKSDNIITIELNTIINGNIRGIGGAFNEQGGEAFMSLPKSRRKAVVESLFNTKKGAGFSFCRTAIGASDFGLSAYSYSETPEDYQMKDFSVERDMKSVIPFIVAAKSVNPDLKMFASPWSPPAWMKVSGKMDGGKKSPETNILRADPKIYQSYALYFSKYAREYAKHGVNIDRIIVQNETDMNPTYPGCDMLPKQMSELITGYIKPRFKKDGIKTEIWAGSFRGHRSDAQNFMKLKNAGDADGVGLQYCPKSVMNELHKNYPTLKMMHTEGRCENGKNSIYQARKRFGEIATWINSGCENYCYWNIALNEKSASAWGWKQNSLIKIDRNTKEVTYNPDFAPLCLLSKYIRPGDKSLKVEMDEGISIAVSNDNRLVVFLQNDKKTVKSQSIKIEGRVYSVEIPAQSLCAVVFTK